MKRNLIVVFITTMITTQLRAESIVNSHFIEVSAGISSTRGYSADIRYCTLVRPRLELGFAISGDKGVIDKDQYTIALSHITASFTFSHILFSARRKTFALWGEFQVMGGYELINNGNTTLPDGALILSESRFVYGIAPALRLEIPLSRKLTLNCKFKENILPPSQATCLRSELSAGIKIKIY